MSGQKLSPQTVVHDYLRNLERNNESPELRVTQNATYWADKIEKDLLPLLVQQSDKPITPELLAQELDRVGKGVLWNEHHMGAEKIVQIVQTLDSRGAITQAQLEYQHRELSALNKPTYSIADYANTMSASQQNNLINQEITQAIASMKQFDANGKNPKLDLLERAVKNFAGDQLEAAKQQGIAAATKDFGVDGNKVISTIKSTQPLLKLMGIEKNPTEIVDNFANDIVRQNIREGGQKFIDILKDTVSKTISDQGILYSERATVLSWAGLKTQPISAENTVKNTAVLNTLSLNTIAMAQQIKEEYGVDVDQQALMKQMCQRYKTECVEGKGKYDGILSVDLKEVIDGSKIADAGKREQFQKQEKVHMFGVIPMNDVGMVTAKDIAAVGAGPTKDDGTLTAKDKLDELAKNIDEEEVKRKKAAEMPGISGLGKMFGMDMGWVGGLVMIFQAISGMFSADENERNQATANFEKGMAMLSGSNKNDNLAQKEEKKEEKKEEVVQLDRPYPSISNPFNPEKFSERMAANGTPVAANTANLFSMWRSEIAGGTEASHADDFSGRVPTGKNQPLGRNPSLHTRTTQQTLVS